MLALCADPLLQHGHGTHAVSIVPVAGVRRAPQGRGTRGMRCGAGAPAHPDTLGGPRPDPTTTAGKDPEDWVTGDEPMTGPQRSYLDTLAREAGEELPGDLTKAQVSEHIERLQGVTGRGRASSTGDSAGDSDSGSAG
jgi:hypothetical protein